MLIIFKNKKIELRDVILGGQDGLVNVLGLSLGLFASGASTRVILIAGLAAGFSEAIAMGGVGYTSSLADTGRRNTMNTHELIFSSFIIGFSALLGSLIPLVSFLFFSTSVSMVVSMGGAALVLFGFGARNAEEMGRGKLRGGLEILIIGILSALAGFAIGWLLKV
ncbi:MAG: VIT1/CCC1 transporter family protein [Candidatus Pacebacteria bacterium]|nr:VIT1/CCC1 transporter family protein [Candidatus Paceibacterota bacterium]